MVALELASVMFRFAILARLPTPPKAPAKLPVIPMHGLLTPLGPALGPLQGKLTAPAAPLNGVWLNGRSPPKPPALDAPLKPRGMRLLLVCPSELSRRSSPPNLKACLPWLQLRVSA